VKLFTRLGVAAVASAIIAWVIVAVFLYAMFAAGGYTSSALVLLPVWAFCLIGGGGALIAIGLVHWVGDSPMPIWVRPIVMGSLIGVAVVAVGTISGSSGQSSKDQARYSERGLVYGVPAGLFAGALMGLLYAWKRNSERGAPPDRHGD
jgi:hypothetical protein